MSDAQKLKDCIAEYQKVNKAVDENLKTAVKQIEQLRQEARERSNRPA